jgi:hypothetical protein
VLNIANKNQFKLVIATRPVREWKITKKIKTVR